MEPDVKTKAAAPQMENRVVFAQQVALELLRAQGGDPVAHAKRAAACVHEMERQLMAPAPYDD